MCPRAVPITMMMGKRSSYTFYPPCPGANLCCDALDGLLLIDAVPIAHNNVIFLIAEIIIAKQLIVALWATLNSIAVRVFLSTRSVVKFPRITLLGVNVYSLPLNPVLPSYWQSIGTLNGRNAF